MECVLTALIFDIPRDLQLHPVAGSLQEPDGVRERPVLQILPVYGEDPVPDVEGARFLRKTACETRRKPTSSPSIIQRRDVCSRHANNLSC